MTRRVLTAVLVSILVLSSCSDDDSPSTSSAAPSTGSSAASPPSTDSAAAVSEVVAGQPFPDDRCDANRAAGTITYLTGFDYAATASVVEVLVAQEKGYFDELCLDVEITPSLSTDNYPLMAANQAQISSAGSFSELVDYSIKSEGEFVALAVEGKTGIDALIVKEGEAETLEDLRGSTIGVKEAITKSVAAMLQQAGLTEGEDYTTVLLDGFDPKLHIEAPGIAGFPGYKSNEPRQLEAANIPFTLFDPAAYEIPGSFGVLYTNGEFLRDHPTAAQDFLRASMLGLADAIADPKGASDIAVGLINANGNAMFLSPEGEETRWEVESALVVSTNANTAIGVPEPDLLNTEVTTYAEIGLFEGIAPDITPFIDPDLSASVYDQDRAVIWPRS